MTQGVALATLTGAATGCTESEPAAMRDSGSPDAATRPDASMSARRPTVPYEVADLTCWGEDHVGGYMGRCCVEAHCYTPEKSALCAAASMAQPHLEQFPPGSGSCGCNLGPDTDVGVAGPFAPVAGNTPETEGECCYLVGAISCTGRPLVVEGEIVIAPLVTRSDWAPFA